MRLLVAIALLACGLLMGCSGENQDLSKEKSPSAANAPVDTRPANGGNKPGMPNMPLVDPGSKDGVKQVGETTK